MHTRRRTSNEVWEVGLLWVIGIRGPSAKVVCYLALPAAAACCTINSRDGPHDWPHGMHATHLISCFFLLPCCAISPPLLAALRRRLLPRACAARRGRQRPNDVPCDVEPTALKTALGI